MRRHLSLVLIAGFLAVGGQAWAFPGQTAQDLLGVFGAPANGLVTPPVPAIEAVRAGTAQLSRVYWPQASYDPFRSGTTLRGTLIATFDYRGPGLVDRLQRQPPDLGWKDLVSRNEVFLAFVPSKAFHRLLAGLDKEWTITSKTRHGSGAGYDVYSLVSKGGRVEAEMSYAETGALPFPPDPGGPMPTVNFLVRIADGL